MIDSAMFDPTYAPDPEGFFADYLETYRCLGVTAVPRHGAEKLTAE